LFIVYLGIGLLFGLAFVALGVSRIDPAAKGAGLGFRLIIFPGVLALWPLMIRRWIAGKKEPPVENNAHRAFAGK
jgi:hypothetical protein